MTQGIGGDAPMALGVIWGFTVISFVFVALRLYTRVWLLKLYGMDDHLYNLSFVILLIFAIMMTVSAMYGFGRDISSITSGDDASRAILYEAIGQTLLVTGTVTTKMSLGVFLLRLHDTTRHRWIIGVPVVVFALSVVAALLVFWFSCEPIAYLWDQRIPGGYSKVNPGPVSQFAGALSVIVDFWYAAVPWWVLWRLNMPKKEKRVVASSLSLGVIAGVCGIMRATQLYTLASTNYLKDTVPLNIWHAAELSVTMICIGIPVCRPLYTHLRNRGLVGSLTGGSGSGSRGSSGRKLGGGNSGSSGHGGGGRGGGGAGGYRRQPSSGGGDDDEDGLFGLHTIGGTPYNKDTTPDRRKVIGKTRVVISSRARGAAAEDEDDDDGDDEVVEGGDDDRGSSKSELSGMGGRSRGSLLSSGEGGGGVRGGLRSAIQVRREVVVASAEQEMGR